MCSNVSNVAAAPLAPIHPQLIRTHRPSTGEQQGPILPTSTSKDNLAAVDTSTPVTTSVPIDTSTFGSTDEPTTSSSTPQGVVTRAQTGKVFPKTYIDGTIRYDPKKRDFFAEPISHRQALSDPAWRQTMKSEIDALHRTQNLGPGSTTSWC